MFNYIVRVLMAYSAFLGILLALPVGASAATTDLSWQDISNQLQARQNRPVWAVAYANSAYLMTDGQDITSGGHVWRMENGKISDISQEVCQAGLSRVDSIAGGPRFALYGQTSDKCSSTASKNFDVSTAIKLQQIPQELLSLPNDVTKGSISAYDGTVWLIINGKNLYSYDGQKLSALGRTQDYFTSIASDGNGSFILGGAVSNMNSDSPTLPLTAKLVKVTEGQIKAAAENRKLNTVKGTTNKISYWSWLEPNDSRHDNITDPKFTVGAQSAAGLKTVDLYVNGIKIKSCDAGNTKKNFTCSASIFSKAFAYGSEVKLSAMVTNSKGKTASVPVQSIYFYDATAHANGTLVESGRTSTYKVSAEAEDGIKQIDIYLNGKVSQTCLESQACELQINKNDYAKGSELAVNARALGKNGLDNWTKLETIKVDSTAAPVITANQKLFAWFWSEPSDNILGANQSKLVRAQAIAADGLSSIQIIANGQVKQICHFNGQTSAQTCEATLFGNDYASNSSVPVSVKAIDLNGKEIYAETQYLLARPDNKQAFTLIAWLNMNPESLNMASYEKKVIHAGGDSTNGVKKIEIFVNGKVHETCEFYDRSSSHSCDTQVVGNLPYADMGFMAINAKVTDLSGNISWSPTQIINITDAKFRPTNELNTTLIVNPDDQILRADQSKDVTATAFATKGLKEVNIYVNDTLWQTCSTNNANQERTCSLNVSGRMYGNGAVVTVRANAIDSEGYIAWSEPKTFTIRQTGTDAKEDLTLSIQTAPDEFGNKTVAVTAYADAPQGIERIEVSADNLPIASCYFGRAYNKECSGKLDIANKAPGTEIQLKAKATDVYGNIKETTKKYIVN
ncbi:MAG: hypothetical protein WCW31_00555 [Patescibacteria group bacterium]